MSGRPAPPKPWERAAGGQQGGAASTPLGPSSAGDGTVKPWERPAGSGGAGGAASTSAPAAAAAAGDGAASTALARTRPWQNTLGGASPYGGVGSSGYGGVGSSGYGAGGLYGSGGYGSSYGSGMYGGGSMYGGGGMYGGGSGMYGSGYGGGYGGYGSSMYGGNSMYGRPYGSSMYGGGYGGGMLGGGPYGGGYGPGGMGYGAGPPGLAPGDPAGGPPAPPSAWQAMLQAIHGVVTFFGRLSFLVDENAHAVHFFVQALLQLLDRAGSLYGELARFVLRLLGYKSPPKQLQQGEPAVVPPGAPPALPGLPASVLRSKGGGAGAAAAPSSGSSSGVARSAPATSHFEGAWPSS